MAAKKRPKLYTVTEAAAVLEVSRSTLYRYIRDGRVKPTKNLVGRLRFTDEQLDAALAVDGQVAA